MSNSHLIWLDLEMTGLDIEANRIIEIATIITDSDLEIIAEGPVFAIHQPEEILALMDDWNVKQHTKSGLIERVRKSSVNTEQAEAETLLFLQKYVQPGKSPLCGNSICMDRRFLARYMPALEKFFHYRLLDVSSIKELAIRWAPEVYKSLKKESRHLALDDIKDSINELKHYRENFFKF